MDLSISLPTVGPVGRRRFVIQVAQAADRLGFHSVWVSSHVALPKERHSTCLYPRATTSDAYNWGVAWLDPIAVMGLVAGVTEHVLIGTHILALAYRNPIILGGELAALDQLSLGRIVLGAGTGWMDEEFAAIGVPKRERGARTNEYIEVLRTLWTSEKPTSFHGRFVDFDDIWLASRPSRQNGPPIYIGGNTEVALRRVARYGEGWLAHELYPEEIPPARAVLESHARKAGRDPNAITLSVRRGLLPPFEVMNIMSDRVQIAGSARQVAEELKRYARVGISLVVLDLNMRPVEMVRTMEWLVSEVAPLLD